MRTITVRELRAQAARIWQDLKREKDIVVTSNGKPVGVLSAASEDTLEQSLTAIRRARAMIGVLNTQLESTKSGRDKMSLEDINTEIKAVRRTRS